MPYAVPIVVILLTPRVECETNATRQRFGFVADIVLAEAVDSRRGEK
jgi:hypothetical protein